MPSNAQNQAIVALAAIGRTEQQIATAVGVELGDVESVLGGGTFTPPGVPFSGEGGSPGSPIVRKFPFAFDTPDLLTGHSVYTPTVGDLLLEASFEINTAWNGTTPKGDAGRFLDSYTTGWWGSEDSPIDMSRADATEAQLDYGMLTQVAFGTGTIATSLSLLFVKQMTAAGSYARMLPAKFVTADPIKVCVSRDGSIAGADPGSTQGSATLYLVTATPV